MNKKRFYWTALLCGVLVVAAPITYADDHGDGGGRSGGHSNAGRDHGNAGGDHSNAGGDHGSFGVSTGGNFEGWNGVSHGSNSNNKSESVDKTAAPGKPSPGDLLDRHSKLSDSLKADLPQGSDLKTEAAGFKNLGQFVATVRVSKNLDIPFEDLKAKMLGGDSLGQAIRVLKPSVDSTKAADGAMKQAQTEIATQ